MLEFLMGAASGYLFDTLNKMKLSNKKTVVISFFLMHYFFICLFIWFFYK